MQSIARVPVCTSDISNMLWSICKSKKTSVLNSNLKIGNIKLTFFSFSDRVPWWRPQDRKCLTTISFQSSSQNVKTVMRSRTHWTSIVHKRTSACLKGTERLHGGGIWKPISKVSRLGSRWSCDLMSTVKTVIGSNYFWHSSSRAKVFSTEWSWLNSLLVTPYRILLQ